MNVFDLIDKIPITITLQYQTNVLKFPVNPDEFSIDEPSNSTSVEIEGIGEVNIPSSPALSRISITSFFWKEKLALHPKMYVAWIETWQKSKKPAKLTVTGINRTILVSCESFKPITKAGEEEDIYFELEMKEYRPYGAKKLNVVNSKSILSKISDFSNNINKILIEVSRPLRENVNKPKFSNPYVTKKNETMFSITKKITGSTDDWELLYDSNSKVLGDIICSGNEIPEGTNLILPKKWL